MSRFDAKARLPFKMAQGAMKGTIKEMKNIPQHCDQCITVSEASRVTVISLV